MADLIIKGGKVIDGTGNPSVTTDVVIEDRHIELVGDASKFDAAIEWDATGKVVCPGFIDIHSHSDFSLIADRRNESAIRQGITTLVTGNCGHGPAPAPNHNLAKRNTIGFSESWGAKFTWNTFTDYIDVLLSGGLSANVAPLIPHGTVRLAVMGHCSKKPTTKEIEEMKSLVQEGMTAGAIGISTGLEYSPGIYATETELVSISRVAAKYGGIYASHIRNRADTFDCAVNEALSICRQGCLPGQLSHLAPRPYAPNGMFDRVLDIVSNARQNENLQIGIDTFPDIWGPGTVAGLLPEWVYEGLHEEVMKHLESVETIEKVRKHFNDSENYLLRLAGLDQFFITSSIAHLELIGKNLVDIGNSFACDPIEGIFRLLRANGTDFYNVILRHIFATQEELDQLLLDPFCSVESDGVVSAIDGPLKNFTMNRSSYGYTIRFIKEYALERKMFSLEEAVRKMTSLPADSSGLSKRGRLAQSMAADVVVLNLKDLKDNTTDASPKAYPSGVELVVVNGKVALDQGNRTTALSGCLATSY